MELEVDFRPGSILDTGLPDDCADVVISSAVLHFARDGDFILQPLPLLLLLLPPLLPMPRWLAADAMPVAPTEIPLNAVAVEMLRRAGQLADKLSAISSSRFLMREILIPASGEYPAMCDESLGV